MRIAILDFCLMVLIGASGSGKSTFARRHLKPTEVTSSDACRAMREFLLGQEALKRFIAREPLRRVHEAVFAVLALESEPVDPRL